MWILKRKYLLQCNGTCVSILLKRVWLWLITPESGSFVFTFKRLKLCLYWRDFLLSSSTQYDLFLGITLTLAIAINLRLLHCTPIKSFHKKFRILAAVYSKVKSLCSVSNQRWALSQIYRKYNHCFKLQCNPDYPNSLGPSKSSDNRGCTVVCFAC